MDLFALSMAIMVPADPESKCVWALTLLDVLCYINIHLAAQVRP